MEREIAPLSDLRSLLQLYWLLRQYRPTIVNASTPKAGLLGMLAAWLSQTSIRIYLVRGLRLETTNGWMRSLLLHLEAVAARCATHVVCNSPSLLREYSALRLAPHEKLYLIGRGSSNGVCVENFMPSLDLQQQAAEIRAALNISDDVVIIGFVGRFTRDKGIAELAAAFTCIVSEIPSALLLMVGDFEDGDPVPTEIVDLLQTHSQIRFAGFVADTAPYYQLVDVLAFPSYREGFPNAPLEAAAAGVPTVGFSATGTVDAVEDGVTGLLVPVGDVDGLSKALTLLLSDKVLRDNMGSAARRRVEEHFSQERVWNEWVKFYDSCLSELDEREPSWLAKFFSKLRG